MFVWPTGHVGMMHPAGGGRARSIAQDFMIFARASRASVSYNDAKLLLSVGKNQAETRKSFYEELALLYVPYRSNQIVLTPLGAQLFDLLDGEDLNNLTPAISRQATALIVWAMCRSQINRPQSRGVPAPSEADWRSCDVRPYAAAWMAVGDLKGVLSLDEFLGPLRRLHKASDYVKVIHSIRQARAAGTQLASTAELSGKSMMNYRIYWRSHLSCAEQVLQWDEKSGQLRAYSANWQVVEAALKFQAGCAGSALRAIQGLPWSSTDEYFMNVAGAACPPFLASGSPTVTKFDGQNLADLSDFTVIVQDGAYRITGGPALCQLALKMPCFHPDLPSRLLRIDAKEQHLDGSIELLLGLGRPIVNVTVLQNALKDKNG